MLQRIRRLVSLYRTSGLSGIKIALGKRLYPAGMWAGYGQEALIYSSWMDFAPADLDASRAAAAQYPGELPIHSITWFLPEFSHIYFGGIYTIFRFANYLAEKKGIANRFVIIGSMPAGQISEKISSAFPALTGSSVETTSDFGRIKSLPPTDAAVCSLWSTAFFLLRFNQTRRKFYFLQDYEPLFYPAGSISALAESTYQFGFTAIANTPSIGKIYQEYGGKAVTFTPAVDAKVFHPGLALPESGPLRVFYYGRPGHPRNGFELGTQAIRIVKHILGEKVHFICAGDPWDPKLFGLQGIIENLGLLNIEQTAELYRSCHLGLVLMFTRHPSYLPFELMASGCPVITNYNPATLWFFQDKINCRLANASASSLATVIIDVLQDPKMRQEISTTAAESIHAHFSSWDSQFEQVFQKISGPLANL